MQLIIDKSWKRILNEEFEKQYFKEIIRFLNEEKLACKIIFPTENNIFNAFNQTPFDAVKVVLIGQDPYHGKNQAHGLSFSVLDGEKHPPSLKNIFKELKSDIGKAIPISGNLIHWANQGILLLNASLTVEENKPMSHSKIGWEIFTNEVIKNISEKKENIIFILWGKFAQEKVKLIDSKKHFILEAAHPSPFSANKGFFGCKHFSKTNEILKTLGKQEILF